MPRRPRKTSTHHRISAMSWSKSNYEDENPFAEPNEADVRLYDAKAPLTTNQFNNGDKPLWLQQESNSQTSASSPFSSSSSQRPPKAAETLPTTSSRPSSSNDTSEMDPAIPRMILYARITNLVLSVCMIMASLLSLLTTSEATTGVLACYVLVFSCLLCCFETHLKQIAKIIALNFGFLYSAKSRSVFMIFVGTILFSFSLFGKIVGCAMLANAFFNIFILFKYPQYEDAQRKDAQSEISDYLSAHPAFAQQAVKVGTDFVKSNPDIIQKGLEGWASLPVEESRSRV